MVGLAEALPYFKSLKKLDLSENNLGDEGAKTLAASLEQSVSVQCQVSDYCVGNLCGSRVTCRNKMTPTSVHLNDHTL